MKQLINKIKGKLKGPQYLDQPTEEGFLLWPDTANAAVEKVRIAAGERLVTDIHRPSIIYYPAKTGNEAGGAASIRDGAAVIIAPGGSHRELWIDHEGQRPAQWLSERGIAAFVLKYRLGKQTGSPYSVDVHALADILRAMRMVRSRAKEWGIAHDRVGVMGFSAGGELAALAAMRYDQPPLPIHDAIDRQSSRPDFQVLIYPSDPDRYIVKKHSPPAFICGGYEDCADITRECAKLFGRFHEQGVRAELHLYAHAGHGFGFRAENTGAIGAWPQRLYDWLADSGFLRS
jgi:endo-1,4-beta-xylanase